MIEKLMIQGILRPELSAIAPKIGAVKAIVRPKSAVAQAQVACARASAKSSGRPAFR